MNIFPDGIFDPRTKNNYEGIVFDEFDDITLFAEDLKYLDAEVVAIETELGLTPKGTSADLAERIKAFKSETDAVEDEITADNKGLNIGGSTADAKIRAKANTGEDVAYFETQDGQYMKIGEAGDIVVRTEVVGKSGPSFDFINREASVNLFGLNLDPLSTRNNAFGGSVYWDDWDKFGNAWADAVPIAGYLGFGTDCEMVPEEWRGGMLIAYRGAKIEAKFAGEFVEDIIEIIDEGIRDIFIPTNFKVAQEGAKFANQIVMIENEEDATSEFARFATLKLKAQGWNTESQPMEFAITADGQINNNPAFRVGVSKNSGVFTEIFAVDSYGNFEQPFKFSKWDGREILEEGAVVRNDTDATATYNQFSPISKFIGKGWNSVSELSEYLSAAIVLKPQKTAGAVTGYLDFLMDGDETDPTTSIMRLFESGIIQLNQAPVTETLSANRTMIINLQGEEYKILLNKT